MKHSISTIYLKHKKLILSVTLIALVSFILIFTITPKYQLKHSIQDKNYTYLHNAKKDKQYVEWWYFNGELNNNLSFILNFQTSTEENFVELTLYNDHNNLQTIYRESIETDKIQFGRDKYYIKFGNHSIIKKAENYVVTIKGPKFYFHFKLQPTIDGFSLNLKHPIDHFSVTPWVVHAPRGLIKGILKNNKSQYQLSGLGYHDHNYFPYRTFFPYYYEFSKWYWARLFTENYTVITNKTFNKYMKSSLLVFKDSKLIKEVFDNSIYRNASLNGKQMPQIINIYHPPLGVTILKRDYSRKSRRYRHTLNDCLLIDYSQNKPVKEKGAGISELIY